MDYTELAAALMDNMQALHKARPQKNINEAMHGEAFILHYISTHEGDVMPGEIGGEMNVSSARVAAALNSLETKGLIARRIDTSDRRKILVSITPEGKDQARKQHKCMLDNTAGMLASLGEHDAKEYVRITGRLAEELPKLRLFAGKGSAK